MNEIVFLGTGAAWGLPEPGCDCPACREALRVPKWHRTRTSFLISSGVNILVDATTDLRTQLLREGVPSIDALILTHAHPDHFLGLDEFRARQRRDPAFIRVPVYVGKEAWEKRISGLFSYLTEGEPARLELKQRLDTGSTFSIGEWSITTFPTRHGDPDVIGNTFGFVFTSRTCKIVYTADYSDILEEDKSLLKDADIFIADSTWLNHQGEECEHVKGHTSFYRGFHHYYNRLQPRTLVLTHISHVEGKTSKLWKARIRSIANPETTNSKIILGYDGLRIKLP